MKQWIEKNLITNNKVVGKRCNKTWFVKNNFTNQYDEIISHTKFLNDLSQEASMAQRIWHIHNDINHLYKCNNPNCNNSPQFFSFSRGYLRTCCPTCAQHDPQTVDKIKSTNIKKYGTEYGLSSKEIIKKKNQTVKEKYGVDNVSQLKDVSDKKKQTCLKNYGKRWFLERGDLLKKIIFDKYGVDNVLQLEEIKNKVSKTRLCDFYDYMCSSEKFSNIIPLFSKNEYKGVGIEHKFLCKLCNNDFMGKVEDGNIPRCITCYPKIGNSLFQKNILNYIKSICSENIIENDKNILSKLELDIYIPSTKIAIECNGLYWHGEFQGKKYKQYHLQKTEACEKQGIHLVHIFEDEWVNHTNLVKNKLRHILNKTTVDEKIYARNCNISIIPIVDKKSFLNENHIQGNDASFLNLGLYENNTLVAVMTFSKPRIFINDKNNRKENVYELSRYATSKIVVGGASKLLSYFIKNYKPKKIISYADRRWTFRSKNLYKSINFKEINTGVPNYWYFGKGKSYKRYHRFNFAKHTLSKKLKNFDPNLSEWENMKNNGWDRIWDCGNLKYELICG